MPATSLPSFSTAETKVAESSAGPPSGRVDMHGRGALLPVFGRAVGLDDLGVGRGAGRKCAALAGNRVAGSSLAEGEPVFGIEAVLVLRRGAAGHAEAVIGEDLAGAGD